MRSFLSIVMSLTLALSGQFALAQQKVTVEALNGSYDYIALVGADSKAAHFIANFQNGQLTLQDVSGQPISGATFKVEAGMQPDFVEPAKEMTPAIAARLTFFKAAIDLQGTGHPTPLTIMHQTVGESAARLQFVIVTKDGQILPILEAFDRVNEKQKTAFAKKAQEMGVQTKSIERSQIVAAPHVEAAQKPVSSNAKEMQTFLEQMGFEDHVAKIKEAQEKQLYRTELNRRQQNRNIETYQAMNAARDLAILIFDRLGSSTQNTDVQNELALLTAKTLALQPQEPPTDYPKEIMSIRNEEERSLELGKWLDKVRAQQMHEHAVKITSDIADLILKGQNDPAELNRIYEKVSVIVDRMYMDSLVSQTRYLGRAMAALLARDAQMNTPSKNYKNARVIHTLAKLMNERGQNLQNFLGDTWVLQSPEGSHEVKVENGSMLMTRNLSAGSLKIAFAAIPAAKNMTNMYDRGLNANLLALPFFVSPEDTAKGISPWLRLRDAISQKDTFFSGGISHAGFVKVNEAHIGSGAPIKMSWTIDNYPQTTFDNGGTTTNTGGVRISGLEQMLDVSHHSKIFVGSYNHQKFHAWAQENMRINGYPKDGAFFEAQALALDRSGNPMTVDSAKAQDGSWKVAIGENEFKQIHSEPNAEKWFKNVSDRFVKKMIEYVHIGIDFQWPEDIGAYQCAGASCAMTGDMAMQEATGLSIENGKSRWHWILKSAYNLSRIAKIMQEKKIMPKLADAILKNGMVEQAMKLVPLQIIAPSSLASQEHVDGKIYDLVDRKIEDRMNTVYENYRENNSETRKAIEPLIARSPKFSVKSQDPSERAAASYLAMEYAMVIRGSEGKQTHVDPMAVSLHGSDESMKKTYKEWRDLGRPNLPGSQGCEGVWIGLVK